MIMIYGWCRVLIAAIPLMWTWLVTSEVYLYSAIVLVQMTFRGRIRGLWSGVAMTGIVLVVILGATIKELVLNWRGSELVGVPLSNDRVEGDVTGQKGALGEGLEGTHRRPVWKSFHPHDD